MLGAQPLGSLRLQRRVDDQFGQPMKIIRSIFLRHEAAEKQLEVGGRPWLRTVGPGRPLSQSVGHGLHKRRRRFVAFDRVLRVVGEPGDKPGAVAVFDARLDQHAALQTQVHHGWRAIPELFVADPDVFLAAGHAHQQGEIAVANVALQQRQMGCGAERIFLGGEIALAQDGLGHHVIRTQMRLQVGLVLAAQIEVATQSGKRLKRHARGVPLEMAALIGLSDKAGRAVEITDGCFRRLEIVQGRLQQGEGLGHETPGRSAERILSRAIEAHKGLLYVQFMPRVFQRGFQQRPGKRNERLDLALEFFPGVG